ncbi:MAG: sugar ABC transporter ATP-binding protein [Planctomycetes bacterium]|nr:sugar ABC transporter ATP-binding protein [Planctomycetota bacterium]
MLVANGLEKSFPGVKALDGVDLDVRAGEIHALVGENGAGKSTLVKILGGAYVPDRGIVTLDGAPLPHGDPVAARRAGMGIIYQEFTLVPELTVAENIFLGRELRSGPLLRGAAMNDETRAILARLGADLDPRTPVKRLSVGNQQLVEIARALASDARVLIFDEPSATLTDQELARLFETLRELRANGLALIYISHRLEEIFALADRVTVLRDGQHVATAAVADVDRARLIHWMVGRELADEYAYRERPLGDEVLRVEALAGTPHFRHVDLTLRRGEILGLAGLVGSGRTEAALAIFGRLPIRSGRITLAGESFRPKHPWHAMRRGLGYLTEDRKGLGIFGDLSVAENMTMATLEDHRRGPFLSQSSQRRAASAARERFDVRTASLETRISKLSGGNQQKALLARTLARRLDVLILDEPTRGVDIGAKAEIYQLVYELAESGLGIIAISSDLPELLGICDRIGVFAQGRTVGFLDRKDASQERLMELAIREEVA